MPVEKTTCLEILDDRRIDLLDEAAGPEWKCFRERPGWIDGMKEREIALYAKLIVIFTECRGSVDDPPCLPPC